MARSARGGGTVDYGRVNRLRLQFFVSLAVILGIFLALYASASCPTRRRWAPPGAIVNVVGKQYAFSLTPGDQVPSRSSVWDAEFSPVADVSLGSLVEFRVRTLDVNHGFGIYTPEGYAARADSGDAGVRESPPRAVDDRLARIASCASSSAACPFTPCDERHD